MERIDKKQDGYTVLLTLSVIMILMLAMSGSLFLAASWKGRASALERKANAFVKADDILSQMLKSIQKLVYDTEDTFGTENYNSLISEYSAYALNLKDVSSGINTKFWSEKITSSQPIQNLLLTHAESDYSWICKQMPNEKTLRESLESAETEDPEELFPLVNQLPLTNIYALDEYSIIAILEAVGVKDFSDKAGKIFEQITSGEITDRKISELFSAQENSKVTAIFGTKTTFWEASFVTGDCSVRAIFAAIPNKMKNPREVDKYILFERHINYRGKNYAE